MLIALFVLFYIVLSISIKNAWILLAIICSIVMSIIVIAWIIIFVKLMKCKEITQNIPESENELKNLHEPLNEQIAMYQKLEKELSYKQREKDKIGNYRWWLHFNVGKLIKRYIK